MPLRVLWSMGLTEGVVQRVDMSLSTNKLASVLASIIGVPCNMPLPRAVLCVPMAVLNEGSQGFNGIPVSFKQTQGDPLLFSMLHRTAGSLQCSHLGACNPHRGPRGHCPLAIVSRMTSSQELDSTSVFTLLAAMLVFYFSVAWVQGVVPAEPHREAEHHAKQVHNWLLEGNVYQRFTVRQERKVPVVSMSMGSKCNCGINFLFV